MITMSYHAQTRIQERLTGLPVTTDKILNRLNRIPQLPVEKVYVEVARFNVPVRSSNGDSSFGDCLVAVVQEHNVKTVVLTFSNSKSSQYANRIIPDYKNLK